MLQLYDKNHVKVEGLTRYKDLNIESTLSTGDKVLSFSYPTIYSDNIQEEGYIRTKTAEFVIKSIEGKTDWKVIKANLNVEDIEGKPWDRFDSTEQNITDCLNLALAGTGWSVGTCNVAKKRTVRKTGCSAWDIVQESINTYRVEAEFNTINKVINIYDKMGSDKGAYFMDSLNLKELTVQSNSYDYYTRIQAIGKDGLALPDPGYVENYQYSNKIKTLYWKDERYTEVASLTEDAALKLDEISKPYKAYGADILDLANNSDKYKDILSYGLGDTIMLISKDLKVKEKQRIAKTTEYPEEPERNTCELANVILSFEDVQKENQDTTDTVNNITEDNGTVSASAISTAVNNLTVQQFSAVSGRIGTLETTTAHITNGIIDNATIDAAKVNNLSANYATIVNLTATNVNITNLQSNVASINTLLAGNIGASNIAAGAIQAGSAVIANGAIASAQIISLDVVKLIAGNISTNKFNVQSDNGNLKILGDTVKLWDVNGKERVSLGLNSGDYNLLIRGVDGTTVLFGTGGVTKAGITLGAVDDSKVDANANINGSKIEKESLVSQINGATTLLKASHIKYDPTGQTLDIAFSTLSSTVTGQRTSISSINTSISAMQGQIALKVSQTDINNSINNIQIGGRNLVKQSSMQYTSLPTTANFAMWGVNNITSTAFTVDGFHYTATATNGAVNSSYGIKINSAALGLKVGDTIVFSSDIKGTFGTSNNGLCVMHATVNYDAFYASVSGGTPHPISILDWSRKSRTYIIPDYIKIETDGSFYLYLFWGGGTGSAVDVYVRNVKVELGTKPTDWTPAPEDTQVQIDDTLTNQNLALQFQNVAGCTIVGNTITKTAADGYNAGFSCSNKLYNGNYVEWTVSATDKYTVSGGTPTVPKKNQLHIIMRS